MTEPILVVTNLTKRFGGFVALDEVDVSLGGKERLGLIGPNGSGKTTLINCISGALFNEQGKVNFEGNDVTGTAASNRAKLGIVRTFQIPRPFRSMTIIENLEIPMKYAASNRLGSGHLREQAMEFLEVVGLQDRADENSANLTQIDMRRLELARALSAKPLLLLSDETMAGLSSSEVDEVLDILFALNDRGVAVIMIEHIMRAVMKYSERIVVLDAGKKIADGSPDEIVNNRDVERAYLGEKSYSNQYRRWIRLGSRTAQPIHDSRFWRDRCLTGFQWQREEHVDEMHHRADQTGQRRDHSRC